MLKQDRSGRLVNHELKEGACEYKVSISCHIQPGCRPQQEGPARRFDLPSAVVTREPRSHRSEGQQHAQTLLNLPLLQLKRA